MENMQKFAAQQLTKNQMNEVKGGKVSCDITIGDQIYDLGQVNSNDYMVVQAELQAIYRDIGTVECQPWIL